MAWFDSHCHLDDDRIADSALGAMARARSAAVVGAVTVGTDRAHSQRAIEIAEADDSVWATVGLHPHDARNGVDTIRDLFGHRRVVAVGECGLDYFYEHSPRDAQRLAFADQIALAHELNLALVIHTRDAWDDTFDILVAEGVPTRTIFHCFSGGPDEARQCLDLGAYLSFSGIVTFPKAPEVREAASSTPLDRMLVETDAPYLAPVPFRGKTNEPALIPVVGSVLSEVTGATVQQVEDATFANAHIAFALPRP